MKMFGMIIQRFFRASKSSMNVKTSALAKLRKSTGYPLHNCKKALELYTGDLTKAEEWLHAEAKSKGWSKWSKIQTRPATQGLIGVCARDNVGVMVEVNCESDFVSRNTEFQQMVEMVLSGCMNEAKKLELEGDITKKVLDDCDLEYIGCGMAVVEELVQEASFKFGERTIAKRAIFLKVPNDVLLSSVSHPGVDCPNLNGGSLGRYAVLLASKEKKTDTAEDTTELKRGICQHIIGMNPLTIGQLSEKDIAKFSAKSNSEDSVVEDVQSEQRMESVQSEQRMESVQSEQNAQSENVEGSDDSETEEETMDSQLKETDETELLFQPYFKEPQTTVGEILFESGVEVVAFERFECGETEESAEVSVSASS